ncbi:MAG: site-specific integrase [Firmicutes bacterium]|nr:site-specific integrase [Bacillota bacterium]
MYNYNTFSFPLIIHSYSIIKTKKIVIEAPKTINSKRIVQISEFCIGLLKELKEEQKRQYKKLNKDFKENYFIFVNEYGEPIYPDTISKRFKKILEKNNLKKITFHELRHTSATLLINSNIDINSVSKRLGHANVSTTLSIYTHVLDKTKQEMANKMNDILTNS